MPGEAEMDTVQTIGDGVIDGSIVTGMPLSEKAQVQIARRFEEMLGKRVKLSCHLDRRQIMGIRVELNGFSYDGTLRGQLNDLRKLLTRPEEER